MEGHMKLETPLHAEHQLDQLAAQFEHWRQTRTHPGERFPQALWDQAVAMAAILPPSRVAKQLRLRLTDLKKQMVTAPPAAPVPPPLALGFVEVPAAPAWPPPPAAIPIELSRPDGTRLCIHCSASALPLEAVVRAFVEARSCSNSPRTAASLSPRTPSISAKASMASGPCVASALAPTPWRVPSMSSATGRARR